MSILVNIHQSRCISNNDLGLRIFFRHNIFRNNLKILSICIRDLEFHIISGRIIQQNLLIMEFANLGQEVIFMNIRRLARYQCEFVPQFS